jgi:hypothetical protein
MLRRLYMLGRLEAMLVLLLSLLSLFLFLFLFVSRLWFVPRGAVSLCLGWGSISALACTA